MTAAGVVTYEPDIARFRENLDAIRTQVDFTYVYDNGSRNVEDVVRTVDEFDRVELIMGQSNRGIADALNRLSRRARTDGHHYMVTLDQDSVSPPGMVDELMRIADTTGAAMVTPYIVDRNKLSVEEYRDLELPEWTGFTQAARKGPITSGALTDLAALQAVGEFDERLFIDYVDYDLNQRLLDSGRTIVRANRTHLLHEVGKAQPTWLSVPRKDINGEWKLERFYSFGHSPMRCYYKARNRVLFTRKYWRSTGLTNEGVWQIPQQIALTILFEGDRVRKLREFLRGVLDGMRMDLRDR